MYDKIKNKSDDLCKLVLKSNPNVNYDKYQLNKLIEDPENIDNLNINKSILLMGLNPGSSDLVAKDKKNNCFLKYVFENTDSKEKCKNFIKDFEDKGYTYQKYYKPNYNLFKDINVNLLWQNENYLNRYYKLLEGEEIEYLRNFNSISNNYIIFSELIFIKETDSGKVKKIINKQKDAIIDLFKLQLLYYKPSLIVVTNAYASNFILKKIYENKNKEDKNIDDITQIKYENIPIIFSSMVSEHLDKFNCARLKKEINEHKKIFD